MSNFTFCFLLSVYGKEESSNLEECLSSIFSQTIQPDEVLIIVEGEISSDLRNVLNKYIQIKKNYTIHFLPGQIGPLGYGLPSCLNYGISVAKSDYIIRIDSDDINSSIRLEATKNFLNQNPKIKLLGSNICEYSEDFSKKLKIRKVPESHSDIVRYSRWRNPFNGPSVVFDRLEAIKLGGYPLVASNEDFCLWALFIRFGLLTHNLQESLVFMRAGSSIIKRRSSIRYIFGEWQSLRYLFGIGHFNLLEYVSHFLIRTFIRILPHRVIALIYTNFLRE
jgi:glycosyltransferase involved in cell wall biosynthesis